MYISIIIFYISLLGIIAMLLLKRHEVRTGKVAMISRLGRGTDKVCNAIFSSIRRAVSYFNRKTFIVMAQWIAFHVLVRVRKVYVDLKHEALVNPHSRKVIDAVRGRGHVSDHGASFYLRRISDK